MGRWGWSRTEAQRLGEAGGGAGWPGRSGSGEKRVEFREFLCYDISFLLLLLLMSTNMVV